MEIATDVKEEDTITTKTVLPIEDINDQTLISPATEINVSTAANEMPALDCNDSNDNEPKTKLMSVVDVNSSSKSVSIEANKPVSVSVEASNSVSVESSNSVFTEHNLNVAMASTTISDTAEVKQDSNEDILVEQLLQNIITTENENSVVEKKSKNSIHEKDETILETDELNSTVGGEYEDARDYIDDEYYGDAKHTDNENERSFISAVANAESCEEEEQVDNEDEQAASSSEMPVPVDDDTNDPQYIPRRGRFYEHDDRMAYSTTSSEDCESSDVYDDTSDEDDDNSLRRRNRKLHIDNKKHKPIDATEDIAAQNIEPQETSTVHRINTVKLNISKVATETKNSSDTPITTHVDVSAKKLGGRKSRNIDLLDKWGHDMYDEREQTRKSRDELLSSYGYDIREEIEAPRARRHHKYGRTATVKYNRSWQDTKAYTGASSEKRGGPGRRNFGSQYNKNKPKSTPAEEYNSEFPTLDHAKPSTEVPQKVITQEHSQVNKNTAMAAGSSKNSTHITRTSTKYSNSPQNRNNQREPQNSGLLPQSPPNKNFFNRNNYNNKEKDGTPVARDSPTTANNSNFFNRKLPQHSGRHSQPHSFKQHYNNTHVSHGNNQSQPSSIRGRNFQQHNNNSPQFNRDRYFSKGIPTQSPNLHHNTVGSGRIQHSEEHYHHYNNQQYENEVQKVEPQPTPVVRSSKRYSVQSRRELPDPVLNFGGMSKVTQQQSSVSQHQQNNSLIMQEPQTTQLQQIQQPPQQMQQPPPQIQQIQLQQPPMQLQQFHQPMPQINSHHSMVVDPNTGMVLMAADPSMYHHQLYAAPQYGTTVAQASPGNSAEDQNAAAVAAAALQMLAAQAAVYQPLPTGPTPVTSPPTGTQPIQQQPPDSFMTTYYQPQAPKQPPPRRVNLAIPIVAPSELNQQQHASKSNPTQTPPPTAASTN